MVEMVESYRPLTRVRVGNAVATSVLDATTCSTKVGLGWDVLEVGLGWDVLEVRAS